QIRTQIAAHVDGGALQPGDRLPIAAGMSRRVQDLLVDARIPQALRAAWPIVVAGDALVWLVGVRAAAPYLADPASRQVVRVDVLRDAAPA
nr:tRNA lysidine(34) synthetase TilS [Kouleothrix sp.]